METQTTKLKTSRSLTVTLASAFFALSAVVLLVVSGLNLYLNFQTQQTVVSSQQELIAQEASKEVSSFIEEHFSVLETAIDLANLVSLPGQERELILDKLLGQRPAFRQLILLNAQDRQLAEASRLLGATTEKFHTRLSDEALAQIRLGQRYISPIYVDDATSEPLVVMVLPVTDVFGDIQGSLAVEVNLKFMWDLVDQLQVGETGYAYVVDNTGNLIAFHDIGRVLKGENVQYIQEVNEFINSQSLVSVSTSEFGTYTGLLGTNVVGTHVSLGTPEWAVVIELPLKEAYRPIYQLATSAVVTIFILAALAGLAGFLGARRLSVPIINLTEVATRIASGETQLQAKAAGTQEVATLATAFNSMTAQLRELIGSLEQRVAERTTELEVANQQVAHRAEQFEAIALVAGAVTSIRSLEELLPKVTELISQQFGYYHTGIFLNDDANENAVLSAANSEGGQRMLARGHQLKIGEQGIVGYATSTGRPRIALDVGEDAVYFDNPDMPDTRSEMALPLKIGENIVGALDVQSTEASAFSEEDINVLSLLADQVSLAIENARLFDQARKSLAESEALYRQYLRQAWTRLPKEQNLVGFRYNLRGSSPIEAEPRQNITSVIKRISEENKSHKPSLSVPIAIRGEAIGTLSVQVADVNSISDDQVDLVKAVAERVALAAENARLFEETTHRAERERLVSDITMKIRSTNDPDSMVQIALDELKNALGATKVQLVPHTLKKEEPIQEPENSILASAAKSQRKRNKK